MTSFVINIDFPERFIGQEFIIESDHPDEAFQDLHLDLCRRSRWSYFEFALGRVSEKEKSGTEKIVVSRIGHSGEGTPDQVLESWIKFTSRHGIDINEGEIKKLNRKQLT